MKKIKILLSVVLFIFAFASCDPNDGNSSSQNDDTFAQNFGSSVSKDFIGQVVDTNNHPIQNAEIKIGSSTIQTDVNGVFIINGANVYEKFAYITAKKAGYIDGSRAMVPTSGKNNVKIMLIANTPLQTVQSGVDSEVSLPLGTKVSFDGEFQDEDGNPYSGTVSVAMFHLLPSDENISKLMPGMLYAQTATNQPVVLETFGMLNVELRGSAGQKINIKEGHTAEIRMKIDDTQLATAPNSIPLWHFDEEKGYWKEDGTATKVGNNYVGTVSHFSWWNCDMPFPTIRLTTTIVDSDGNPLSNVRVGLLVDGFTYTTYAMTNTSGQVSGLVPANTTMTLTVVDICGNAVYTQAIGPFASDTVLPNIVITSGMAMSTVVQGTLLKCDNTNVTNGYVILHYGSHESIVSVTNGDFSFSTIVCTNNNFTLQGIDYDAIQTTGIINYQFTLPTTQIGNLQACNTIYEFISYQIDNNPIVFLTENLNATINNINGLIGFNLDGNNGLQSLSIYSATIIPGIYTTNFVMYDSQFNTTNTQGNYNIQYTLNQFGAVGEYIDMTFNGTYQDLTGNHSLTGTVHVIRDN